MFANRFTALVDACVLAGALKRNLLLTLAEAEFFRVRWSEPVLDETERAIRTLLHARRLSDADARARRARRSMEAAFEEALVVGFESFLGAASGLPDPKDAHVLAAALKAQAAVVVTDNLRHFPSAYLHPLNIEARSGDAFIADTIALDPGKAVEAIKLMRTRLRRPERSAGDLLLDMEVSGLPETVDVLRSFEGSL